MAIQTFPDARFSTPIELPNSSGFMINGTDAVTYNRGQSVTVINGFTYIILTTGNGNKISMWSDNPNYYTSTPFDLKTQLIAATVGVLVDGSGRAPKVFSDGNRLYLSYQAFTGGDYKEERFAICPDPDNDMNNPLGWFHLDLTTTVDSAGEFMLVAQDSDIPPVDNLDYPGSLHVQGGWVLTCWLGFVGSGAYTNLAIGRIGNATWNDTIEYIKAKTGPLGWVNNAVLAPRYPICFFDPWGYVHLFVLHGSPLISRVVHIRSASPRTLDLYSNMVIYVSPVAGNKLNVHWSYRTSLDLNDQNWGIGNLSGGSAVHGTTCLTPDGLYGFSIGHYDHTFSESNVLIYNIFRQADPTRPIAGNPHPWQKEFVYNFDEFNFPSQPIQYSPFKSHHIALSPGNYLAHPDQRLIYPDTLPGNYILSTQDVIHEVGIQVDNNTPTIPEDLTGAGPAGIFLASAKQNIRAVANSQPRLDSAGFFAFRTITRDARGIIFDHYNTSGRVSSSTMVTFTNQYSSSGPIPLGDVHTIWMSKPEAIRPIVFGETDFNRTTQGRYWVTFFGGTPALPNERSAVLRGSNDPIQAYAEDLE